MWLETENGWINTDHVAVIKKVVVDGRAGMRLHAPTGLLMGITWGDAELDEYTMPATPGQVAVCFELIEDELGSSEIQTRRYHIVAWRVSQEADYVYPVIAADCINSHLEVFVLQPDGRLDGVNGGYESIEEGLTDKRAIAQEKDRAA